MKENVRKYFMKGTDDELQFGDMIELDFVGEEDGVRKHTHLEVKFLPEYVDELLEDDIIEVREEEDSEDDEMINFGGDFEGFKQAVAEDIEDINEELLKHDKRIAELEKKVALLQNILDECGITSTLIKKGMAEYEKSGKTTSSKKKK